MADTKLSALSALTPTFDDLIYGVDDPGGTPASKKILMSTLPNLLGMKPFISGLQLTWVSASAINVELGSAYIESLGYPLVVSSVLNITSISLGNSTWGYAYLLNDGTAECVTTAPAAAYAGTARSKTAANTRRFLGAVRTDASGNIYRFWHQPQAGWFLYQAHELGGTDFRVLSNGSATSSTAVSCAAVIPPQSRIGLFKASNLNTGQSLFMGSAAYTVTSVVHELSIPAAVTSGIQANQVTPVMVDSSQQFAYLLSGAGAAAYVDVMGFQLDR